MKLNINLDSLSLINLQAYNFTTCKCKSENETTILKRWLYFQVI